MDSRRVRLKELAARSGRLWGLMPIPEYLAGETRIETRNAVYRLRDGICYSVQRDDPAGRLDPSAFVGMRVVGWLWRDDPRSVLALEWQPGAYAVLWRRGTGPDDRAAVALTSASVAFRQVARSAPARPASARRSGAPPPLPPTLQRALARPPTPPSLPVPARRSSIPPPLPPRARLTGVPRPYRAPAILS
jgi:hypothetical protein